MPQEYKLKSDPFDENRVKKVLKEAYDEAREDRQKAFEAYDYFQNIVASAHESEEVVAAQKAMVDCLKLAQDAKNKCLKALEVLIKFRNSKGSKSDKDEVPFSFEDMP